jgi:hypothetical protein
MAILRQCSLYFAKLDPKRPNRKYNKENPTWELQIRTEDPNQKKEWEALNIKVKAVIPDDGGKPYWFANLRKKSIKVKDNEPAGPVDVKDAELNDVDPNSIGNASIGNVRIFQYEYPQGEGKGTASVLMGVQLTKHIVYTPKPRDHDDEFQAEGTTEVITPPPSEEGAAENTAPSTTSAPSMNPAPAPAGPVIAPGTVF